MSSITRLIQAAQDLEAGKITPSEYDLILDHRIRDTIEQFEATGSPVITMASNRSPASPLTRCTGCRRWRPTE